MAKTGLRLLAAAALPSILEASRKSSGTQLAVEANATDADVDVWAHWDFTVKGVSCVATEFEPFHGFQTGELWPKCKKDAVAQAWALAKDSNCRVCDIAISGKKPEALQGLTSTACKASVTCAAKRLNAAQACFTHNGNLGRVKNLNSDSGARQANPGKECITCPNECKECIYDNSWTSWTVGKVNFKCIIEPTGSAETGERCVAPTSVKCGDCKHRKCSGWTIGANWGCYTRDYKTMCNFPAEYATDNSSVDPSYRDFSMGVRSGENKFVPPTMTVDKLVG